MSISLDNAMWLAVILTDVVVILLLFYRQMWRTLPVFCSYVVWDVVSNACAYSINRYDPSAYFKVYFIEAAIDAAFLFCVLVELAWSVLRPLRSSLSRSALVLVALLILVAAAAIWPFAVIPSVAHATSRIGILYGHLFQTTATLRVLFFLVLAGGSQFLSISWRDRELQVATGLGIYSLVSLTAAVLDLHQTSVSAVQHINQFVTASYLCCLAYWVFSFAQKEVERREFTPQMQNFLLAVAGAARSTRVALADTEVGKPRKSGTP